MKLEENLRNIGDERYIEKHLRISKLWCITDNSKKYVGLSLL